MKKIFTVFALIGLMQLMEFLKTENFGMIATLTASGFVILAAYTLADIGSALMKLPRVTGYILAGILLGPFVTNILSSEVVSELTAINTLALGLIALNAGLELSISGVRTIAKTLTATIGLKLLLLPLIVGGALFALGSFAPHLIDPSLTQNGLIALAWLFAALAIGTSPAIVIAVSSEMKAKGRLTDLVLGAAIFKDLVVVIALALVIAFCVPLLDPEQTFSVTTLTHVGYEILMALVLGSLVGGIITAYIRYVNYQMLLFIFCVILIAAEVAYALHAELLLVFIAAGFVVRNFTPYEKKLHTPLELVALPTFVVFFTIAGAGINLPRTLQFLPAALVLFGARALAYIIASRLGARGEAAEVKSKAWLGYLPQAGVTLGLIGIAAGKLTTIGPLIMDLGIAVVALNLLIGPLGLRFALAGEAAGEGAAEAKTGAKSAALAGAAMSGQQQVSELPLKVDDPELASAIAGHIEELKSGYRFHIQQPVDAWHRQLVQSFDEYEGTNTEQQQSFKSAKAVSQWLTIYRDATAFDSKLALMDFWRHVEAKIDSIPATVPSAIDRRFLTEERPKGVSASALIAKVRHWWLRLRVWLRGDKALERSLPLANIFQAHTEQEMYQHLRETQQMLMSTEKSAYLVLFQFCSGQLTASSAASQVGALLQGNSDKLAADIDQRCERLARRLGNEVNLCGTPQQPRPSLAVADVAEINQSKREELDRAFRWDEDFSAVMKDELQCASSKVNAFVKCDFLIKDLDKTIDELLERTSTDLKAFQFKLEEVKVKLAADDLRVPGIEQLRHELIAQIEKINKDQINHTAHRFAVDYSSHKLGVQVKKIAAAAPYELTVLRQHPSSLKKVLEPMEVRTFEPARTMQDFFAGEWVTEIDEAITDFRDQFTAFSDLVDSFKSQFTQQPEGKDETELVAEWKSIFQNNVDQAHSGIKEYLADLHHAADEAKATIETSYGDTKAKFEKEQRQQSLRKAALGQIEAMQSQLERLLTRYQGNAVVDALIVAYRWYKRTLRRFRQAEWNAIPARIARWLSSEGKISHLSDTVRLLDVSDVMSKVSPLVRRGFSLAPLRDPKFFIANKEQLARATELVKAADDAERGTTILITGLPGAGKSSLLNMLQTSSRSENVVTLDHQHALRRGGVFAALARQLDCLPTAIGIRKRLAKERTTIIIDNVEYWFTPTLAGLDDLRRLLELIIATSAGTHWLLTSSEFFLNSYGDTSGLRQAIQHHIRLAPQSVAQLKEVILARAGYCGLKINYQELFVDNFSERLRFKDREDIFFQQLARKSHGNIHQGISLWLRAITFKQDKTVWPRLTPLTSKHELDLASMPTEVLAVQLTLHRHGPLAEKTLVEALPQPQAVTINALRYLNNRQLIELFGRRQKAYRIKPTFHPLFGYFAQRRY